jgi:glycyl-tRNA synthetase beta subunit
VKFCRFEQRGDLLKMCQASFDRAILTANQFLKHKMLRQAQITLYGAARYGDNLPNNNCIIADIQKRINEMREGSVLAARADGTWQCGYCKNWVEHNVPHDFDPH